MVLLYSCNCHHFHQGCRLLALSAQLEVAEEVAEEVAAEVAASAAEVAERPAAVAEQLPASAVASASPEVVVVAEPSVAES